MHKSFADLGVSTPVIESLAKRDIVVPFAIQSLCIADAIAGRDILAKSRTGSGKTLGFGIPIVERVSKDAATPAALVLVPTRELAVQVAEDTTDIARTKHLRVATAYGGVGIKDQAAAAKRAHILIATPGRLEDLVNRRLVKLDGIEILVLDEADRMLDMGFLPQVDKIVQRLPKQRQTMFFSATLDGEVGRIAAYYTRKALMFEVESSVQTVDEVEHLFVPVTPERKVESLVELLGEKDRGLVLIFVRTKRGADRLVDRLKHHHVHAAAMHGDMTQSAREKALTRFETGKVDVLVATDVAARGLDLDDISHVVNFDPPEDDKAYVHRVGRTARAGRSGTGVTLVLPDQRGDVSRMAARLKIQHAITAAGMVVQPPRTVYSSGRRGGVLGKRPRRRF